MSICLIWSHVNENENIHKISKMQKFGEKWSEDMVTRYLSTKFDIKLLDGF